MQNEVARFTLPNAKMYKVLKKSIHQYTILLKDKIDIIPLDRSLSHYPHPWYPLNIPVVDRLSDDQTSL